MSQPDLCNWSIGAEQVRYSRPDMRHATAAVYEKGNVRSVSAGCVGRFASRLPLPLQNCRSADWTRQGESACQPLRMRDA